MRARELIDATRADYLLGKGVEQAHVRMQARRVKATAEKLGLPCPPGAGRHLVNDSPELLHEDSLTLSAWCAAHALEWVESDDGKPVIVPED